MAEPIRILHVLGTLHLGGAESRIMDLYRQIDKDSIQFDFLIHTEEKGYFEQEILSMGGRIYRVPRFQLYNYFSYRRAMKDFFQNHHEFRAVQGHMTSTASIYLPIAHKAGIPMTIAHARSAGVDQGMKGRLTKWMRRKLYRKADVLFTCSELAGEAVFGPAAMKSGKVIFIPNAIDASQFTFDTAKREKLRKELGIEDKLVIGHVGRFHYAKNHEYLLDIFAYILRKRPDAVLLLLGEGPGMDDARRQAEANRLDTKVFFLGNRVPVSDYYQAMDYFVYPSRFEGLPGTIVEAQAAGLRSLMSDRITTEAILSKDLVQIMSIDLAPEKWAEEVVKSADYQRENQYELVAEHGFDCKLQAATMQKFYASGDVSVLRRKG